MSKRIMLINATDPEEIRVAILKDGILSDFDIEFLHHEKIKGNIYKARVIRVDASLQAAFVHYGAQKNGFLPIAELPRSLVSPDGRRGRIQDLLQKDQEIMVQVVREELGTKGAMVTAQISLPGRYLVLTPNNPVNGISRKIESQEEREHFKELVDELVIPDGVGVIVRTASLGVTREDFAKDIRILLDTYKEVQTLYNSRTNVGLVWQEDDVVTRTLRDTWTVDIEEIHIDDLETFKAAQGFFRRTVPQHLGVIRHYTGKKPIFSKFQTEEQIERIYARRVPLPSGGAIVLDQTEALVAIDVNSGKTIGDNQEDTALRTNLEAATEIATQLRLRDMAGLIVIDFIDVKRETSNKAIMERLVECLRMDKARMEVGKINRFGVLVMTRQRIRPSIHHVTYETCPVCQGTGQVKNSDAIVLSIIRRLKSTLTRNSISKIQIKLSPTIAMNLLNKRRSELTELEVSHSAVITVEPDHGITYGDISMEVTHKDEAQEETRQKEAHERKRDKEDETVVLGGDAPISFDRALNKNNNENGQEDRRGIQRAALEERERLRTLFEGKKAVAVPDKKDKEDKKISKEKNQSKKNDTKSSPARSKLSKEPTKREPPRPPQLSPEIIASLAVPTSKPRKLLVSTADSSEAETKTAHTQEPESKASAIPRKRPAKLPGKIVKEQKATKPAKIENTDKTDSKQKQVNTKPKAATAKQPPVSLKKPRDTISSKPAQSAPNSRSRAKK